MEPADQEIITCLREVPPPASLLLLILQFSELLSLEGWDFPEKGRCQGFRAR